MEATAKQQVVERLKAANNVLVTVSANPSVDQLAGAIALTVMVNLMNKHATAVFSGQIPDTMQFLNPGKTLENTVDSLRDFIIALDKNKADKLRYKVEDDVVKIFITPYRTRISQEDLDFSQGDYNVDIVIALGVHNKQDLDKVIVEHGRILHDAPVVSVNTGTDAGNIGSINWVDSSASSLTEMLMSISEALQPGLVNAQVATALLTGIVSETDRFSNEKTTPKIMTMAAQLMAAGANQQLIAKHLHPNIANASIVDEAGAPAAEKKDPSEMDIAHDNGEGDEPTDVDEPPKPPTPPEAPPAKPPRNKDDSDLEPPVAPQPPRPPVPPSLPDATPPEPTPPSPASVDDNSTLPNSLPPGPIADMIHDTKAFSQSPKKELLKPSMGGTFNATATEANEDSKLVRQEDMNNTILNHEPPVSSAVPPTSEPVQQLTDKPSWQSLTPSGASSPAPASQAPPVPNLESQPKDDFAPTLSSPFNSGNASAGSLPPIGEANPGLEAAKLDGETLANIDSAARNEDTSPPTLAGLDEARHAVEEAMGSSEPPVAPAAGPIQAIGINGRLDIHPEDHLPPPEPSPSPQPEPSLPAAPVAPPPTPPPFGPPPTPDFNAQPSPFAPPSTGMDLPPTPAAAPPPFGAPAGNAPSVAPVNPVGTQPEVNPVANVPLAPPTPPPSPAAQPSANDFTLPSIT